MNKEDAFNYGETKNLPTGSGVSNNEKMVEMWDGPSKQTTTNHTTMLSRQLPHGASTGINGNEAYTIFLEVVNCLENVDARCKTVLRKCKVNEKDAWGKGLHIFIPGKQEGILAGTRSCLLPLITNTPIQVHCSKR